MEKPAYIFEWRLSIRLAKHCIYNISPSYEEDNSPPPTIHHNTAIHARNCTLLLSKINIWNIVYSSVPKRNKKLDRARVPKFKKVCNTYLIIREFMSSRASLLVEL